MPRPRAFSQQETVRAARAVFWRNGFEATSIPDLETATGLSRSSIYNAFGSKRGLFDAVVQSYLDEVIRPRLRPLQETAVDPEAILVYLDGLSAAFAQQPPSAAADGCLLINTAGSPIAHDAEIARIITAYRAELGAAIRRGVDARLPDATDRDRDRLATAVTALVVAAFTLVRVSPAEATRTLAAARDLVAREA